MNIGRLKTPPADYLGLPRPIKQPDDISVLWPFFSPPTPDHKQEKKAFRPALIPIFTDLGK
ncbi:Hypothetical protein CpCAPGE03_0600 [Corynebacterium pseudotuberculosis]|nr:Hypothetical protein CpCAPGE03_0600 [Corynebacterium pseudotuberculosis]